MPPSINTLAVALEVTEEGVKFLGALQPQRTLAQGPEGGLTIGGPEGAHPAAKLRRLGAGEGADGWGDMPAIQHPEGLREGGLAQPFQAFVAVAEQDVEGGAKALVGRAVATRSCLGGQAQAG